MQRFTISLEAPLAEAFDRLIRGKGYRSRSEAIRDLLRQHLGTHQLQHDEAPYCIATLSYIYNHHQRELAERLTALQHRHHDLTLSAMHAHLDHDNCIEAVFLRGPTKAVREFADALLAERGVRHGQLNLVPAELVQEPHQHQSAPGSGGALTHVHSTPKT
ncbi:MAG: Nickel-responsive regulator [Candidatus Accumulibacter adjunctus]|uniref:Putative nickel-responsive regulator n=1 Tax=Candidatus Accumulibacter adjunctus TaxID=1454001 RepID=A0A011PGY3_9PROT|nr:MAG: Nickel-responsive regulator [Candidatus Accumulibacter adjunctus]